MTDEQPDQDMEKTADELEQRTERLGEHLDEARDKLQARAEDAGQTADEPAESGPPGSAG